MSDVKKILIVEDEKPMARALEIKLNNSGFFAKAVFNGEEAIATIEREEWDFILSDLIMPKMDGFSVLKELKKRKLDIPVVILSNLSHGEDMKKAKELGAIDFFIKSNIPIADIVDYLKKHFNQA